MGFASTLEAARKGSAEALGELLQSCNGYIRVIAENHVPHRLQSRLRHSSLVQETYLRACQKFHQFRGQSERQLLIWLKQILLHCLLNILRQAEFRTPRQALPATLAGRATTPLQQGVDRECSTALELALRRLPAHYQLTIELHHFRSFSSEEVGKVLGCSAGAGASYGPAPW